MMLSRATSPIVCQRRLTLRCPTHDGVTPVSRQLRTDLTDPGSEDPTAHGSTLGLGRLGGRSIGPVGMIMDARAMVLAGRAASDRSGVTRLFSVARQRGAFPGEI